jgi:L-seryl-tRNA(Ser) seleniumtransferase
MTSSAKQDLLRKLPSVDNLLASAAVADWLDRHPRTLVVQCLRDALEELRRHIANDTGGRCGARHVTEEYVLSEALRHLEARTRPHLRGAINATGILLHTGLGRSVWPECVVDSMVEELKGYVTLAVDRETGKRSDRDRRVEYILEELTGAEAATVVNNNAAATMLVLSALAAGRETIVSRGQLIEIGGAFRLPARGLGGAGARARSRIVRRSRGGGARGSRAVRPAARADDPGIHRRRRRRRHLERR